MLVTVEDKHVSALIADAKYNAKLARWPLLDCMFFGNSCGLAFVVPVPAQIDSLLNARYFDVAFRCYVNANTTRRSTSFTIDSFMIHVDQYPVNSAVRSEFQYAIFLSRNSGDPVNALIKSIHGGGDLGIPGCVLVVRSDQDGIVKPIYDDDCYFIEIMLIEILSTRLRSSLSGAADVQVTL